MQEEVQFPQISCASSASLDDKRPLECTWEGCGMTFKWARARTKHLRLHAGERPYKCKIEGCGRTLRFVPDFSRHRRKTGHYVNTLD